MVPEETEGRSEREMERAVESDAVCNILSSSLE